MFDTNVEEVKVAFTAAKNANAALKTFIKREVRSGDPLERFAKDFRTAVASGKDLTIGSFIERHYPKNEIYFLALARYAHPEFINSTVEKIFSKHADDFNTTYEKVENGIKVTNDQKFTSVAKEVVAIIESDLKESGLPVNNFMKKSALLCVFEPDVLTEVLARLK